MRLIDADRLLTNRMKSTYYHLPNGDIAIPIIDVEHAPTIEVVPLDKLCDWLAAVADGDPSICMECAGNKGDGEWECPDEGEACKDSEVWKRHIRAWMQKEGLNAAD